MKKINSKVLLSALLTGAILSNTGCKSKTIEQDNIIIETEYETTKEDTIIITPTLEKTTQQQEHTLSNNEPTNYHTAAVVQALETVNIRKEPTEEATKLGQLTENQTLPLEDSYDDKWYKVKYKDGYAYISKDYAKETKGIIFTIEPLELVKANKNTPIYNINDITQQEETLANNELAEVYDIKENYYLIKSENKIGFVNKEDVESWEDTMVVVDISDQELKVFQKDKVVMVSPVVTGKPSTPTPTGEFQVFEISRNRDLVGENNSYRSYVDIMMKFHNGVGFHDAEYHTDYDENGKLKKSHGWRNIDEFGGETYKHNGSHGCVNMPHDKAIELSNYVAIGTRVLVKE